MFISLYAFILRESFFFGHPLFIFSWQGAPLPAICIEAFMPERNECPEISFVISVFYIFN
jgi:hypothetical protein